MKDQANAAHDAADKYTFNDLLRDLQALTPEQREQQARCIGENSNKKINGLWLLKEAHVDPSGEGLEPVSAYPDMDFEGEQLWPAGLLFIEHA